MSLAYIWVLINARLEVPLRQGRGDASISGEDTAATVVRQRRGVAATTSRLGRHALAS